MPGRSSFIERVRVELTERLQRLAVAAADLVVPGMVVGLGTGSTADAVTRELGRRVAGGLEVELMAHVVVEESEVHRLAGNDEAIKNRCW